MDSDTCFNLEFRIIASNVDYLANPIENTAHPPNSSESNVDYLANPNPSFEHVGIDDECLYIDIGPQNPIPAPQSPVGTTHRDE